MLLKSKIQSLLLHFKWTEFERKLIFLSAIVLIHLIISVIILFVFNVFILTVGAFNAEKQRNDGTEIQYFEGLILYGPVPHFCRILLVIANIDTIIFFLVKIVISRV